MTEKGCFNCRHHSKQERRKALEVGDGDLELVAFDDKAQIVLMCVHDTPREMGPADMKPGTDCELWELGGKKGLPSDIEKMLARHGV